MILKAETKKGGSAVAALPPLVCRVKAANIIAA